MSLLINAQTSSNPPSQTQIENQIKRQDEEQKRRIEAQRQEREKATREREAVWAKDTGIKSAGPLNKEKLFELEKQKLAAIAELNSQFYISDSYRNKYSEFLKQKNTGIARMLPDTKCDVGLTVTVSELERCANVPQIKGNGSRYSIKLNFIPSYMPLPDILNLFNEADIYYNGNSFYFGNESTQSIVSEIGDADINEINAKSPVSKVLTKFKPSRTKTELQQQRKILEKGITENGYFYSNFASVKNNSVYVFRSITFSRFRNGSQSKVFWNTDLLGFFKVVGKEDDGSIVFIWKKLKEENAPYLKDK